MNLPLEWNGRSLQYGGGGFNGVLITGLALPPAQPFGAPAPLARGFVTYGTDSGHETKQGEPPQTFALNDEAFENFAYKSYKKVRDAAVAVMVRAYGNPPAKLYFMGSSEGGREGLTMAQRYPDDFDGIFARVPVINWVGLQHAGTRAGLATMGDGWIRPAQVKLVADAVLRACDKADGVENALVQDAVGCKAQFKPASLRCTAGQSGDECLTGQANRRDRDAAFDLQIFRSPWPTASTITRAGACRAKASRRSVLPAAGLPGGSAPRLRRSRRRHTNGIAWIYGAGGTQYVFARDPKLDVTTYKPEDHKTRVLQVSQLMDSTDPDLSRFGARGGKLVILEYMADYAQSPYAGIRYFENVQKKLGKEKTAEFARLYTAPGVDHVGSGAPANVDMLSVLVDWVENGKAPGDLEVAEQKVEAPSFETVRALPLCQWPAWPRYKSGPPNLAASFSCVP